MHKNSITPRQQAISLLCIAAFFWACRSCKYSTVQGERHTKICKICNSRFFVRNRELKHTDHQLANADHVTWTFEDQKNLEKDITIPHDNNNEPVMNPVRALAATVKRILSYPGTNENTNICTYFASGRLLQFSQDDILQALRQNADNMGKATLGYSSDEIGTKSIRSAVAMAMFMDDTPVFMIMLIKRWSSDAFLKYIRRQVLEFGKGMSRRMVKNEYLYSIPSHQTDINDPRTQNSNSFATNLSLAPSSNNHNIQPAFSLWH